MRLHDNNMFVDGKLPSPSQRPARFPDTNSRFYGCPIKAGQDFAIVKDFEKKVTSIVTAMAGSDVVQSGRQIFDDFFQHLWPYIGNNTANVVFQMVKRLWLIRIDQ
ncbi:hypothetical protein TNCV_23371 [Trichonephila clavipes]|nr:hypothetical protein TNCV_23371 [Trichonephila clavipes]